MMYIFKLSTIFLSFSLFLTSCTTTEIKQKPAIFHDDLKLENEVLSLMNAEDILLDGKEKISNGKSTSELTINITNLQRSSTTDNELNELAKGLASIVKNNLRDPNQFEYFHIVFINKAGNSNTKKIRKLTFNVDEL